jgi:DNA-binding PadR family transcriptional regulator
MHHRHLHYGHRNRHAHDGFGRGERFGRGHGRFGGRMRLGRMFDHGDLRLVVLQLIAEKPRHGYEIIKAIEEKLAGAYSPSPGVVYPTLTMLEELGYAALGAAEGSKKPYEITPEGQAHLAANRAAVDAIFARMAEVSAAHGGGPAPQIVRAMENLKLALRMKLASGPLSDERVRRIAAALDAAATEVDQI